MGLMDQFGEQQCDLLKLRFATGLDIALKALGSGSTGYSDS